DPATKVQYENPAIYGQANSWYSTHPTIRLQSGHTRRLTLAEKFEPFFSEEIQRSWTAFLGPLSNTDPADSSAPRKSWEECLRWIVQLNLRGFMTGLAPLQFANNLVLSGIAESPSPELMAQWIFANRSFGAFKGLQVLGFNLTPASSASAVRACFCSFYYWLEHHLTPNDKAALHFDTIFVEHLLCKIGRWQGRLQKMGKIDLGSQADTIFEECEWKSGENMDDHTKFPIP
ncbi:hypothetical protein B0H15DRAFT_744106, partial [Mycena belliarum]